MQNKKQHTFHIPVMGLGYTIDTPIKVGKYGISSVISIIEDELVERMREIHAKKEKLDFIPVLKSDLDRRAKRITLYLNQVNQILEEQIEKIKSDAFTKGSDITRYFELLPDNSSLKKLYHSMKEMVGEKQVELQQKLRSLIQPGAIDVNIMTKCDRTNYTADGVQLPAEYNDAVAALRGFANSDLSSSVVFSAGLNPRLYSYCEKFNDFFPDKNGVLKKKIILKVSDFRSALVQGKVFAKKGLWVSEYRIESGLNCGGHAFATEGYLMGPILQEFKENRDSLLNELWLICQNGLKEKGIDYQNFKPTLAITAQGGIGTHQEDVFLQEYYSIDSTGWGSPFLLVPEATNVDEDTLKKLASAKQSDYYLSHASPLGVPFNNFRPSSGEEQRKNRIEKNRPGSPCHKKYLAFDKEYSEQGICTSSRKYQYLKIKELEAKGLSKEQYDVEFNKIVEKDCLCEGLGAAAIVANGEVPAHKISAVTICPGPNLAYFSNVFSLDEMVGHIYGRNTVLNSLKRPNMFINELKLYIDYLRNEVQKSYEEMNDKKVKYFTSFKNNLLEGIDYYKNLAHNINPNFQSLFNDVKQELKHYEDEIKSIVFTVPVCN